MRNASNSTPNILEEWLKMQGLGVIKNCEIVVQMQIRKLEHIQV